MPRVAGVKRSIDLAMVEIGRFNTLTVVKIVDFGVYLDGGERGEILMPKEYVPANCFPDDEVFISIRRTGLLQRRNIPM